MDLHQLFLVVATAAGISLAAVFFLCHIPGKAR